MAYVISVTLAPSIIVKMHKNIHKIIDEAVKIILKKLFLQAQNVALGLDYETFVELTIDIFFSQELRRIDTFNVLDE